MPKKILWLLSVLFIAGYFFSQTFLSFAPPPQLMKTPENSIVYTLDGKKYNLLIADEEQEWTKGLMDRYSLAGYDGMIFIFPTKQARTFWNQNTHLNLKIVWLDGDTVVGISDLPSIEKTGEIKTVGSPAPVNQVIEFVVK